MQFDYKLYRWFITSAGSTVVGGKSSAQNDELLKKLKASKKDFLIMHTTSPGSPFTAILSDTPSEKEIEETSIFTGCFSRAWREGKKKVSVDIFRLSQLYKSKEMKVGTWGVRGAVKRVLVSLELVLTKQNGVLRAIPEISLKKKKDCLLKIRPGKIDKVAMLPKIQVELAEHPSQEEVLSALPSGGVSIVRKK